MTHWIARLFNRKVDPVAEARARLQADVDRRANSIEIRNYRANRAAAKAGWRKRRGLA